MKEIRVDTLSEIGMGVYGGGGSDPLRPLEVGKTGGGDDVSYNGGDPYSGHCGGAWSDFDDATSRGQIVVQVFEMATKGTLATVLGPIGEFVSDQTPGCSPGVNLSDFPAP